MDSLANIAFRKVEFLPREIDVERRPDGVIVLRSRIPLAPYERHLPALLRHWAQTTPDAVWLAQRRGPAQGGLIGHRGTGLPLLAATVPAPYLADLDGPSGPATGHGPCPH